MKKWLIVLLMLISVGCVNGKFEVPDQTDQEKLTK
jgi:hypothetical protein